MSPGASAPRRFLALWFPFLPCERSRREAAPPEDAPLALVAKVGNALRLMAVDAAGSRAGLAPGMTLADARARCPALASLPHVPAADARALGRLARAMRAFTPTVALDPPDGLLLDITGCAHLFGGETAMADRATEAAGFVTRHAFAGHAAAARALVRFGGDDSDVRALPVMALELPEAALAGLRRAGLRTLGDLAVRPLAGLAARFGEVAVTRLRAILGEAERPIAPETERAAIGAEVRFAEPVLHSGQALAAIERLLHDVAGQMEARRLGGRRFTVVLERADGAKSRLAVETGRPCRDPAVVMRLLQERIDGLADPLDPGFGFDAILLAVPRTEPLEYRAEKWVPVFRGERCDNKGLARQVELEGRDREEDDIAALVDRLATRLGPDNVRRLAPCDTHIPEAAQRFRPPLPAPGLWPVEAGTLPRPLLLFDPPQTIEAVASVPDGPPQRFRWRGKLHEVRLAEGPERIAPEWWRTPEGHHPDAADREGVLTRDYYRVEDAAGQRFWVFRHGLFDERTHPRWYVHGLFA